jgi:hypothetical protein
MANGEGGGADLHLGFMFAVVIAGSGFGASVLAHVRPSTSWWNADIPLPMFKWIMGSIVVGTFLVFLILAALTRGGARIREVVEDVLTPRDEPPVAPVPAAPEVTERLIPAAGMIRPQATMPLPRDGGRS